MTVQEYIQMTSQRFVAAGVHCADPVQHTELVIQHAFSIDKARLISMGRDTLTDGELERLENFAHRRMAGEPLQYIAGHAWFWDSKFSVGPGVLIPRKETEHSVEALLLLEPSRNVKVAELGPGSGNIGISVLKERPHWEWHAFEKNPATLPYLRENVAALLPVENRFSFYLGDFFDKAIEFAPYDIVVSNPPYISLSEYRSLARELSAEPELALLGGETGSEILDELLRTAITVLKPEGLVVCEIGSDQGAVAHALALRHGFSSATILKDYAGLDRVLIAHKGKTWTH